jgi:hypothetical protein
MAPISHPIIAHPCLRSKYCRVVFFRKVWHGSLSQSWRDGVETTGFDPQSHRNLRIPGKCGILWFALALVDREC